MDSGRLARLNEQSADLFFELHVALQDGLPDGPELEELRTEARDLFNLQERLSLVSGAVTATLDLAAPRAASVYGRSGRMG